MTLYVYQQDEDGRMEWLPVVLPPHLAYYLLWCGWNVVKAAC